MANVLLTGGSGLIGKHLCQKLQEKGYDVAILSREKKQQSKIQVFTWDIVNKTIEKEAIEFADYIVHLAGENIGEKRWTAQRKQQIIDSRVQTAELIYHQVKEQNKNLKAIISASAVGYYGAVTTDHIFTETDPAASDFLGKTCSQWEQSVNIFQELGIRTVNIRTAVVLSRQGGALSRLTALIKTGLGSALGTGKQYMPWIHMDDLCNIYIKAIEDSQMKGPYNAVAPEHQTNKEFSKSIARVLRKPFWFPNVPSFVLQLMFGKMSGMLLQGSRVTSEKIRMAGYSFLFPTLKGALSDLIGKK